MAKKIHFGELGATNEASARRAPFGSRGTVGLALWAALLPLLAGAFTNGCGSSRNGRGDSGAGGLSSAGGSALVAGSSGADTFTVQAGSNAIAGAGNLGASGGQAGTSFLDAGAGTAGSPSDAGTASGAGAGGGSNTSCNSPVVDPYSMSIAGTWDFAPAGGAATKIQVPGGGWIKQGFNPTSATYKTQITIPNSGAPQTTLIEFGAVNFQSTLSVDGTLVGTNTTSFTPSVFDVSKFVTPGKQHSISVLVKGKAAFRTSAGEVSVPAAGAWQSAMPQGIFRSATVRVYPDVYISDAFVRTSVASKALSYDVWVTNTGSASQQLTLSGTLASWNCNPGTYPTIPATPLTIPAGATQKITVGPIAWSLGTSSYWWPNVPYQESYQAQLHNLLLSISNGTKLVHSRIVRFGFREFTQAHADSQHTYYYLNGIRANLRGDSLQGEDYDSIDTGGKGDAYDIFPGFLPASAQNPGFPQAVRNYERLNYNIVRLHQELAAPYMLDVADELGLMLIDETAIRGSENDEDFVTGHDNMVNHAKALVLRDRNHPSVIRWGESNEADNDKSNSVQFATDLYNAMNTLDGTRPISADLAGTAHVYDSMTFSNFSVIGHYRGGIGKFTDEVNSRADHPFGQGEYIWYADQTRQGMMWFATSGASMRIQDASDIRPYTLLSAWASFVPGVKTSMMRLEPRLNDHVSAPPLFGEDNLPDPWSNLIVQRIQAGFSPLLVADQAYWEANKMSNTNGDWPTAPASLTKGGSSARTLVVFNDTFSDTAVTVVWEVHGDTPTGAIASSGTVPLTVPLGSMITKSVTIQAPTTGTRCYLVLKAQKGGLTLFQDSAQAFALN